MFYSETLIAQSALLDGSDTILHLPIFGASHRKQLLYLSANRISIRCQLDDSLPAVEAFGLQDSAARKS